MHSASEAAVGGRQRAGRPAQHERALRTSLPFTQKDSALFQFTTGEP